MASEKDFSRFVVVHWNRPRQCLATILSAKAQIPDLHVLVLDNNSSSSNYEILQQGLDRSVKVLRFEENKGWGPALNVVLRKWLDEKKSQYCFISAHDAEPAPDCLSRLQVAMDAHPKLGIACPRYADGSLPKLSCVHGVSYKFANPPRGDDVEYIDVPHGTLMIVRQECLAEIGLFDEQYFAYGDEHELGARARRHDWKVGLVWDAMVANPQTSTPDAWRSYLFSRNSLLLVRDCFGRWAALLRATVVLVNIVRHAIFPQKNNGVFSAHAQWRGFLDYFAGRFGPPPSLTRSSRAKMPVRSQTRPGELGPKDRGAVP